MYRLLIALVKSEHGFTATECGIMTGLTAIFVEKIVVPF